MSHPLRDPQNPGALKYIVTHLFCPLQLPDGSDHDVYNDHSLATAVASTARLFRDRVDETIQWHRISRMLDNLSTIVQFENLDRSQTISQLRSMNVGDILVFLIRAQNAAVVVRKQQDVTIFESFEVSPKAQDVIITQGKLICSYPGPAIEIPNLVFEEHSFVSELANFLVHMNNDVLDAAPMSRKAQSAVLETRDTTHPRYITELFTGILRSVGRPADIVRISKRVGDDVVWKNSELPWRRSSLWLAIRVALQTSLSQSTLGHETYKAFVLFFMCRIARQAVDLPNDLLQFMSAKISRRLCKLGPSVPNWLSSTVLQTCTSLRSMLEKRLGQMQAAERASPVWAPSQLDLTQDIQMTPLSSGNYICNSLANRNTKIVDTHFNPKHHPRSVLGDFLSLDGAFFEEAYRTEPYLALYDVEQAVEEAIDSWVEQVTENDKACERLELLANRYSTSALKTYGSNPELLSVMLLTTIELWVALDKIAIKAIPMLSEYSPEIPICLLERLLLRKTSSLRRLRQIYHYLSQRHSQSRSGCSVFSPSITSNHFAIRYFGESPRLQTLKARIEANAQKAVDKKLTDLEKANADYAELEQTCLKKSHSSSVTQDGREFHSKKCSRCRLERRLGGMKMAVHEWPLPAEKIQAELVVFELDCPVSFNMWRTATFHLLVDICSPTPEPENPYLELFQYDALHPYFIQHPRSRISLGSTTKPFVVTHYSKTRIPSTRSRVCVNNGLQFYGFDTHARISIADALGHINVSRNCTYELQSGPYKSLQIYIDATSHTSNEVLANQADCHKDLSIHEFLTFGHLRSGGLLQWLNILRALRDRSLSFRHHQVHLLVAQAASQVGPLDGLVWKWHEEIRQPSFCHALMEELECLWGDIEANWLEGVTMVTISFLLCRLLSFSPDQAVSRKVLGHLRTVRTRVFSWVKDLSNKISVAQGDEELRALLRDTAAICRSTFDVDPGMIPEVLSSAEDVEILLSCAILIHDNTPDNLSSLPAHSQLLLNRDRRLSLNNWSTLSDIIGTEYGNRGIDLAVRRVWSFYHPGSKWGPLRRSNPHWFSCATVETENQHSQVVYLNLLDGSLLVDGKPLGRLPQEIVRLPLYDRIFGKQILDVAPSDLLGMDYSTRNVISNHQVYFSLVNEDLVIQAKRATSSNYVIFELVPQEKLVGDLPAVLIEGHAHWLNLSTSILEIRPFDKLWHESSENWKISCIPGKYRVHRGPCSLVDIRSSAWKMVSDLLKPLDSPQNLIVTASPTESSQPQSPLQLSVDLPRYGLSFYVNDDGDLESRNIRGMVYDQNQSIGAMFGLFNKLVLRPKIGDVDADELVSRCVLIPEGDISYRQDGRHVRVEIHTDGPALQRITYQTYRVNTELGCLTGNVSLTNKLYCAYLHALTSGCGTDLLTSRSGTEEALSILQSAGCRSIMKFSPRDAELLGLIALICPSRTWYPEGRKSMQKVQWRDLPASSQLPELYVVAKAIKEHCERTLLFHGSQSSSLFENFPCYDNILLNRGALRAAYLYPSENSPQLSKAEFDVRYLSRDLVGSGSREYCAYTAATIVYHRIAGAATAKGIKSIMKSWKTETVSQKTPLSFQYDRSWMEPDLPLMWPKAYDLELQSYISDEGIWHQLLFSLPAMAYTSRKFSDLVPALVAFVLEGPHFLAEDSLPYGSYVMSNESCPSEISLRNYVRDCAKPVEHGPESGGPEIAGMNLKQQRKHRRKLRNKRRESDTDATVRQLLDAWPCETPPPCSLDPELYDVNELTLKVQRYFSSCYRNFKLKGHLVHIQGVLDTLHPGSLPTQQYSFHPSQSIPSCECWSLTVDQLFARPAPSLQARNKSPQYASANIRNTSRSGQSAALHQLIASAEENAVYPFQREYVSNLRTSAACFQTEISASCERTELPTVETLATHYARCKDSYAVALRVLRKHLGPRNQSERALEKSGQWPRITAHSLFQSLASNSSIVLSDPWKKCLTRLALLALELQRARRLLRLQLDNHPEELHRELLNKGCDGWDADEHPDWLLIQLQGNFLIRRVQVDVANQMISPLSGMNTAMQLNMGEGKSSVIIPISVAVLADGDQIARVIVPKALTTQMFQLLVDRLGGLVNRRIYIIPFSRSLEISLKQVTALRELMVQCMKERGILVVQPDHVLSLKLVSVEKQLSPSKGKQVSSLLLEIQKWLHSRSRDIMDESDEILHVRYQLIYTIGHQQHMEGFPERWTTTQQVLSLVKNHASSVRKNFPLGIEYERGPPGSFPHFRVLQEDAGQQLISLVLQDIMDGRLANFGFQRVRRSLRSAIRSFISCEDISPATFRSVKKYCQQTPLWSGLLLLRGLLATGILLFAFGERRWRVNYGLALVRTMLAVPYRAKDVPAQRAEFGHPDVAIIFTCLSYYYSSLDQEQLETCFDILLNQEDPSADYDLWVRECSRVPGSLRSWSGINIKSSEQWHDFLLPLFSKNKATIDFYLAKVVFPREAKEFPSKLSCSGWDLAEKRERVLTGFSGTNDGRYLLPLHISQHDPEHQRGTNAKVLAYILQPENNHYICTTHKTGERRKTSEFLTIVVSQQPEIRVLLDVGAQMLDLQNKELAAAWLAASPASSHAAIYFDEDDELTVLTRDGNTELLLSSPFAQQLDQCIVYLDDAHTRGTDINFPSGFRAAVTLGPKVTKDRLVQGCMRMRKLGHGHSIMFFAPLEVDRRIRYVVCKAPSSAINVMDVLQWAIRETCDDIQQRVPHWAQQGMDHTSRYDVWSSFSKGELTPKELSVKWLQPEAKKLTELYGLRSASDSAGFQTPDIRRRCISLGVSSVHVASMDEEQEREIIRETERERHVERPPRATPAVHSMHSDVIIFVKTGIVPRHSAAFHPAFETLHGTSAITHEPHVWTPFVLATTDFQKTVSSVGKLDDYLRPVQWIVSGKRDGNEVLVILSPYEANYLMPHIRSRRSVHLHLYTPRVAKSMKACDDLALYSIPTVPADWMPSAALMDQLNVFSGQLYLKDYETYVRLCRFLCVYTGDLQGEEGEGIEVESDGFIAPKNRTGHYSQTGDAFKKTPVGFLRTLTSLRRKGLPFASTHMGKLLDGKLLSDGDPGDGGDDDRANVEQHGMTEGCEFEFVRSMILLGIILLFSLVVGVYYM